VILRLDYANYVPKTAEKASRAYNMRILHKVLARRGWLYLDGTRYLAACRTSSGSARASSRKPARPDRRADAMADIRWKDSPQEHDYPAAAGYLALLAAPSQVEALIVALRGAPEGRWKAKDILRAAALPLLPVDNPHVAADLHKIHEGKALSPILLVRGDLSAGIPMQIADGYHRVCASYHTDENTDIPCRMAAREHGLPDTVSEPAAPR
jgi:hypothetical protein